MKIHDEHEIDDDEYDGDDDDKSRIYVRRLMQHFTIHDQNKLATAVDDDKEENNDDHDDAVDAGGGGGCERC